MFEQAFNNIDDEAGGTSELDYTESRADGGAH